MFRVEKLGAAIELIQISFRQKRQELSGESEDFDTEVSRSMSNSELRYVNGNIILEVLISGFPLQFVLEDDRLNQSEALYTFLNPSSEYLKQGDLPKKNKFSFSTLFKRY